MAEPGHAPSNGTGNALYCLGQGFCPNCKPVGAKAHEAPELVPGGNSSMVCPECDRAYPVGGGVP